MARPKKIEHFKIRKFENKAKEMVGGKEKVRIKSVSWQVAGTKANGVRVRQNFAEESDAIQTKADLEAEFAGQLVATPV